MANKKIELGLGANEFSIEKMIETLPEKVSFKPLPVLEPAPTDPNFYRFAAAALQSINWNQIGMSPDEAAKLCWQMAIAMMRNKL
jgi:hypothetical protein